MWSKSPSSQSRASRNARLCQSVFRFATHRQPQTRRAESLRYTPLPIYVGPRRSGQSLPPVPSAQVSAESAEPFGLVILAGSNLLRLHFLQRLPSAGPTHPCEGQCKGASIRLYMQAPVHRPTSLQPHQDGRLPRPTALPPYAICVRLQPRLPPSLHPAPNSIGHLKNARLCLSAKFNVISRPKEVAEDI